MAQLARRLLLVREVWGSNLEPIISPTHYRRLATAANLMCEPRRKAAVGRRSLATPEVVLSEYNEDLIFDLIHYVCKMIILADFCQRQTACLHDQNKSGIFGGPAFFQPIRAFWILFQFALIGWIKAGPPKRPLSFWNRLRVCSVLQTALLR